MLNKSFIEYIPKFFTHDEKLQALVDKIDSLTQDVRKEIIDLETFIDPVRMPSFILNDMGDYLNAGLLPTDSDRTKRQKITNAVQSHKFRGTWKFDVKPTIDAIIGEDSKLSGSSGDSSDFIVLGQEANDPDFYWGTVGLDGVDDNLGVDVVGEGNEIVLAGIFVIDIGLRQSNFVRKVTSDGKFKITSDGKFKVSFTNYTEEEIENLKLALEDSIPDYFRVFLGYTDTSGNFIFFDNGQIN